MHTSFMCRLYPTLYYRSETCCCGKKYMFGRAWVVLEELVVVRWMNKLIAKRSAHSVHYRPLFVTGLHMVYLFREVERAVKVGREFLRMKLTNYRL